MAWSPVLRAELADRATAAAREIALGIAAAPRAATPRDRVVFWAYAAGAFDEPFANAAYDAALDDLIAELHVGSPHIALYGGLAGVGWALCHVVDDADAPLGIIDRALVAGLSLQHWPGERDLTRGLVGLGVYFLERIDRSDTPLARDGLARVVDHLARTAIYTDDGATWPERDCGVAHGVAGTIALLGRASSIEPSARTLCTRAMRWLAAQRLPPHPDGRFPTQSSQAPARARAAWCYGDPGVALALWSAASRLGSSTELAYETALDAAARAADTCGVRDASLCHGAAGLAHVFGRLYHATGDERLADAARAWIARTLEQRADAAWRGDHFATDVSLLEGAIGVALALLAAATDTEPNWDRLMLCDLPPPRA